MNGIAVDAPPVDAPVSPDPRQRGLEEFFARLQGE